MASTEGKRLDSPCGIYCGACAIESGTVRDAARRLQELIDVYGISEWAGYAGLENYEGFAKGLQWFMKCDCPGCRAGGGWPDCPMRKCTQEKDIEFCYQCSDFPCEEVLKFDKGYGFCVENNRRIKEIGLEGWLKEQGEKVKAGFSYFDVLRSKRK